MQQELDEDEQGDTANEDQTRMADKKWMQRIVDEDHSRIADKDRAEIEHRQKYIKQT